MMREHEEQKAKIERVSKQMARYARELRTAKKIKGESHEEVGFLFCSASGADLKSVSKPVRCSLILVHKTLVFCSKDSETVSHKAP